MKKMTMFGMVLAYLLAGLGFMAVAAPANGAPGMTTGMSQGQQAEQKPMHKKMTKRSHSRRRTPEEIRSIQQALNTHGAKLVVDGKWGRGTRLAIKDFQKAHDMRPTGYANKKTRKALGLSF